ncbi:peptide/nickel transport system permease protein [Saccharicrinis carchari]|uniref:Peptide/nickel transport system permease protein n=1 Tax=Saccharicrinis carchari TaxID=1168039 RepID=A0A521AEQ1_SACCC|nr:ABC transporter permease [Saccharicrinis carchari]SMO33190.1 peptide/nickel transport system permease protein [Saccharicrinis carchari]
MIKFIFRKTGKLAALLVAISLLSFVLISYSPVDPVQSYIGAEISRISPEQREDIEAYWGLHQSKPEQFFLWAKAVGQGNLGESLIYRKPVSEIIVQRFSASILLMGLAWVLSGIFGFILGIAAGMNEGSLLDRIIKSYSFILASTPAFWFGILVLMVFAACLNWFPVGLAAPAGSLAGEVSLADTLNHLVLPVLTLSIGGVASIALHTREKLIEVLNSEFIRFAKAKGESGTGLLWRHGLRNISLPAISLHFASFGELFGGAVLTEQVFSYPGLGQAVVKAGLGGDVPLLLGITLFSVVFIFVGNFMADLLYVLVDPRMKIKQAHE